MVVPAAGGGTRPKEIVPPEPKRKTTEHVTGTEKVRIYNAYYKTAPLLSETAFVVFRGFHPTIQLGIWILLKRKYSSYVPYVRHLSSYEQLHLLKSVTDILR